MASAPSNPSTQTTAEAKHSEQQIEQKITAHANAHVTVHLTHRPSTHGEEDKHGLALPEQTVCAMSTF